jgi:biopolymer transport protein ExbD
MAVKVNRGKALESLSLTPLIDVVFLLLIFFLLSTEFAEEKRQRELAEEKRLRIELPEASEAMPLTSQPSELFVHIDKDGRFFCRGDFVDGTELLRILKQAWRNNPGRQAVIIRADRRCQFDYVVKAMNACNQANIRDYQVTAADSS